MSLREKQKTKTRPEKRVVRIEEKARGRREGKGGGGEEEKSQLGGVLRENEKFRGSRGETEIIQLQNELYRCFLKRFRNLILLYSLSLSSNLLSFKFPWKLCVRTGLDRATPTGPRSLS